MGERKKQILWIAFTTTLYRVTEKREVIDGIQVKAMADEGHSFFKICLTILPKNYYLTLKGV